MSDTVKVTLNNVADTFVGSHPTDALWLAFGLLIVSAAVCAIPLAIFGDRINAYLERREKKKTK